MGRIIGKVVLLFACFLAFTGCIGGGTKVFLKQTSYNPSFETANLSAYKGKTIYFSSVTNNAANTSIWDYYSAAPPRYAYEATPALQTYFWDCFVKSFNRIGVRVLASPWIAGTETAPELQIVLNSVSDQKFVFTVNLIRPGESTFQKEYTVESPPAATTDLAELEKRGYRLVDDAFLAMVGDPGFKNAFLKK